MVGFFLIIGPILGFLISKIKQIACLQSEKCEKTTLRKKVEKRGCAKNKVPYNAHPLRRQT
ncbi:hypothetical protein CEW81_02445 [Kluyvera genomosp. 3]|uniref:Uncharacterized protein n=1 Tax=Kluyvera genomosp. 3 TaxID=2774055 RepID=A0A248KFM9_9ENTR|nr:hypothetical protein CEW81_02445 [Kluyvera genomosp. 3]